MKTVIRHDTAPTPLGCRWCGVGAYDHARRWVPSIGWHAWAEPTRQQVDARLRTRLAKGDAR